MYYLGIDLGSSSAKLALVAISSGKPVGVIQEPSKEMPIYSPQKGWAEQDPLEWWNHICNGIENLKKKYNIQAKDIKAIGIAYQMHGLVLVDDKGQTLRNSIIWCDSRAVATGEKAYKQMGHERCDDLLLNSPANFTASKLKWVQTNQPDIYDRAYKFMLPGDYIAYRFSNTINTTISGLSEGIFWDFKNDGVSQDILKHYEFSEAIFPDIIDTFSEQAKVSKQGSDESGLLEGTPILYRAGDQPNNALALNVFEPGDIAATGGTSGVVYAVTNDLSAKECSRVNNFAHVNYQKNIKKYIGKLLCINGAGIQYRWLLNNLAVASYQDMNKMANEIPVGSDGLVILPFGNGAERMLLNKDIGTQILNLDLNRHSKAHLCRAALEGIAFAFVYGMEILKSDGIPEGTIRAGNDNLFRAEIFSLTIATLTKQEIEIYDTTGAIGAARACGITAYGFDKFSSYMTNDHLKTFKPLTDNSAYLKAYKSWKAQLEHQLNL